MNAYFFTFGVGYNLADAYVIVFAESELAAREYFIDAREAAGLNPRKGWASVYTEAQFNTLREPPTRQVPVDAPAVGRD